MDSQSASNTSLGQSISNSLDKDNEMNTSLKTESAILNTEKRDIIVSNSKNEQMNHSTIIHKSQDIPYSNKDSAKRYRNRFPKCNPYLNKSINK